MRNAKALGVAVLFFLATGCMNLPPRYDVSPASFKYGYDVPSATKQPRGDITLAVVRPEHSANSMVLGAPSTNPHAVRVGFSPVTVTRRGQMGGGVAFTDPEVRQHIQAALQSFVDSAKVDLEKIFIAKGIKTMGPFGSIGEMTFSQKRDATFALAPEIHVMLEQSGQAEGVLSVGGWFSLILIEPLSGQKIWVKKLEQPYKQAPYVAKTDLKLLGPAFQEVTTDNRAKVAGDLLSAIYRDLMEQIWQHADPEEFASLLGQADDLKVRAAPGMTAPTRR